MKNILSIGCALLILSACQKNMTNTPNTVKDVTKSKRFTGLYGLYEIGGTAQLVEVWNAPFINNLGIPMSYL
jgi:hypothetical protein